VGSHKLVILLPKDNRFEAPFVSSSTTRYNYTSGCAPAVTPVSALSPGRKAAGVPVVSPWLNCAFPERIVAWAD
jgi:hypothetical protein